MFDNINNKYIVKNFHSVVHTTDILPMDHNRDSFLCCDAVGSETRNF